MTDNRRVTVTAALPYIHGVPHLGNIVGSILPADIFHRYLDVRGVENEFIGGSDVHGTPLELEALERGMDVEKLAEQQHRKVKNVLEDFEMDYSIYSNTNSEFNRKQTHDMFEELYLNGYITEKEQTLPYCNNDERFLPDRYIEGECPHCGGLARGDQCDECGKLIEPEEIIEPECQICGENDIEFKETTHLYLDLPQFKDELEAWLENADSQPVPDSIINEVENAIENTEQRCITRDIDWGFEIPADRVNERIEEEGLDVEKIDSKQYEDKVLYVWFDAPIGYIGFTRELFDDGDEWKDYWTDSDTYYSIGKDNTIFHTVIWPSMLIGASTEDIEYELPHYEFIQQFLMAEDTQFSKSRGTGLSTEDALEMYPADYWRFYLARKLPQDHDAKFSWSDFEAEINNVLNDTIGNFVNRTLSLAEKWFDNEVPVGDLTDKDRETVEKAENLVEEYCEAFENHDIREGLEKSIRLARLGDQYLSEEEPWNNEDQREETIHVSLQIIRALGATLYPFTPETSRRIGEMLNTDIHTSEGVDELVDPLLGGLEPGHELGEREILFEKIDIEEKGVDEEDNMEEKEEHGFNTDTVSFEDFTDMDIRVGEVQSVEDHPNADRLYKVKVDVGEAVLQTCAGLKNHYEKEELEGKTVVVLANLEPTELRGEKSECMMLAAEDEDENVSLLRPEDAMKKGSKVK
ncbi:methionine--tRNA ligase [Candidatus Nanosalina sp. VS9-1]|uniref:methionine--tRNA ligase n=1 Tax=Candidatus Nanosalina sp. VS9-1 TaxID=3388566 RepID=UPI0039E1DDCA